MSLRKVKIENFKIFDGTFELELNSGLNILVGDNEVGKSTILEAIHLALTGMINGRYLNTELTQYLFNNAVVKRYLDSLSTSDPLEAPRIKIELFFNDVEGNNSLKTFMGGINTEKDKDAFGILFVIEIDDSNIEYKEFLDIPENTLPIEFYDYKWYTFADALVTAKNIPIKSALIDSSLFRYQNGSDIYISRIVRQILEPNDILKMSQAHRTMRDYFMANDAVREINQKILSAAPITDKTISLSAEFLSKNAWENGLITYVNKVPFQYVGKGEQCVIKTKLALASKKAQNASVLLMEEPENHLTHARLNQLLENIESDTKNRQVIISTHSSFVANKLGFDNLILLNHNGKHAKFKDLSEETSSFFKKLPGYDTLRLVLCQKAILVEGPSDELIIQKAYLRIKSKLPIQDGIEVISVGTSFLRFLHVAEYLDIRVAVV
ncbi:MAG: AAA family ATPase, partial [Chitinispirillales bacterium]|nr:AAA family ATPase [Chitinispirillales bacterium]